MKYNRRIIKAQTRKTVARHFEGDVTVSPDEGDMVVSVLGDLDYSCECGRGDCECEKSGLLASRIHKMVFMRFGVYIDIPDTPKAFWEWYKPLKRESNLMLEREVWIAEVSGAMVP